MLDFLQVQRDSLLLETAVHQVITSCWASSKPDIVFNNMLMVTFCKRNVYFHVYLTDTLLEHLFIMAILLTTLPGNISSYWSKLSLLTLYALWRVLNNSFQFSSQWLGAGYCNLVACLPAASQFARSTVDRLADSRSWTMNAASITLSVINYQEMIVIMHHESSTITIIIHQVT